MAFTAANLVELETAITDLAGGASMVQLGNKMYRRPQLRQLQQLYDWMSNHVSSDANNGTVRHTFNSPTDQDTH